MSLIPAIESGIVWRKGASARYADQASSSISLTRGPASGGIAEAISRPRPGLLGTVCRDEHVAEAVAAQKVLAVRPAKATQDIGQLTHAILPALRKHSPPR